jgi:hypothetical protein
MQLRTHTLSPRAAGPQWANDLPARIQAEYSEMPGLRLTIPQAARLWNVDQQRCEQALDSLAEDGFLLRLRDSYVRSESWQKRR